MYIEKHREIALDSDSYIGYLDEVAAMQHPQELLSAILWFMDTYDKLNILEPALRELDFELLNDLEYCDLMDRSYDDEK